MRSLSLLSLGCGVLVVSLMAAFQPDGPPTAAPQAKPVKYAGQKTCKSCHSGEDKSKVHEKWAGGPHAGAFATLATAEAKKIAKEMGIDDAQKSPKCLKCHVTAFDVDKKLTKKIKHEDGVQCETCHGAGDNHKKARMKAAMKKDDSPPPAGEISVGRDAALCKKCHNEESPTYKPFCFKASMKKIEHLDARKKRSEEELKKLRETCTPDCEVCAKKDGDKK